MKLNYVPLAGSMAERLQYANLGFSMAVYSGESLNGSTIATLRAMQIGG